MSSLAHRKYLFRRRPIWRRVAIGVIALAAAGWAIKFQQVDAKPGGYRPDVAAELLVQH